MQESWSAKRALLSFFCMAAVFLSSAAAGEALASYSVPNSFLARAVAFMILPLCFVGSMIAWQGLTLVSLACKTLWRWLKKVPLDKSVSADQAIDRELQQKAWVFIAVYLPVCAATGLLVSALGGFAAMLSISAQFSALGLFYGGMMFMLAKSDLLPIFEEI